MFSLKDFNTREDLETEIVSTYGRTTDPKEDTIEATAEELRTFKLKHGCRIWGVQVVATDYQQKKVKNKKSRGEIKPSVINGLIKNKNARKINKSKNR